MWLMQSNNFICTQHILEIYNFVTNLLSFQGTVRVKGKVGQISDKINPLTEDCTPNDILTDRIISTCPQLVPTAFQICPLESKTLCWALQAGHLLASLLTHKQNKITKGLTESGGDGPNSVKNAAEEHCHCFKEYAQTDASFSSKPSSSFVQLEDLTKVDPLFDTIRRTRQPATSTLSNTRGSLSLAFRMRIRKCPMHNETDQKSYISEISKLFKAFEQTCPPTKK